MRRLTALVVVAALALSALPLPAEAATSDLRPRISATYSKGSAENTGVGEARPTLPEAPQDIAPPQRSGGYFTFRLTCDASGSNCDAEPPLVNWDFGDGTVAENQGPTVTHEYVTPGVYTVRATATKGQTWFGETTRVVYVSPHYSDIQTAVTYRTGVLADEPYAYWPLDSDTEDAAPGSRNSLEAAGEGEVTFDAAAGLNLATNPSAAFDGETWAEGTWTGPEDRNGNLTEATIELWARTTSESTDATTLLSYSNDTYTDAIRISNPESVTVQLGASIVDTSTSVADGAWHHIRLTWSSLSGFASISIDGAEVYAAGPGKAERFAQGTVIEDGGVIVIGADVGEGVDASTAFEGQIDEVAIWDKALPSATAKDRYQAGMAARAAVDRPDRESLWVGGALGIFPPCRVGTAASGAYGLGIGRAQFCPEPAGVAPAPEFPDDTPAVNAITGEDCLARAGACGWPLSYFGDSYSEADEDGVTALKADGYIKEGPGGEWLLDEYKPDVCGDGWVYRNGRFEKGSEQGCLTRGDWYRALIRAVDGRAADDFVASPNRVTANTTTTTCEDIDTESSDERWFSLLRAIRLGIAETVTHPDTPGVRFCDIDRTVTKYEAFLSLGYALGAVDGACGEFIRDLFGDEATGAGGQDPNCGRIYTSILTGVPLVGALTCPDEGEEDAPEGICFNPDEYLTRAEGAVLISGVLVREIPASNALSVHVTADPAADAETPASVNHPITVTAVVTAPPVPESFGTYSVSFAIDGDASGITTTCPPVAQDTATSEDIVGGTQLQLVFSCRFTMQQERTVTVKVDVTGPPPENAEVSGQTTLFAVNYPPFINDVGTHETLDEGPGSDSVTAIATDPAGQDVYFEVASTPEGPFVGADVEEDAYGSRIRLIDQPIGWWRLDEASRFTKVRWFDVRDSKFDGGVDEVNYYPTASTMDSFFDPDEVELKGTADHPYALSFISTKPPYMESQRNNYFSWQADTYLYVPESGTWWFAINAGDAADVSIDGQMVVSAYGRRPIGADQSWDATGSVTLEAGWHKLRARLVQGSNSSATNSTGFGFQLGWHKDTDDSYTIIPAHQFGQPLIDHTQDLGDPNWDATQGNPAQAVGGHTELLVSNPALAATTGGASYRLTGGPQAGIVSNPHTTHLWPLDFSGADLVGDRPMVLEKLDLDRAGPGGHDGWRSNTFNHDFDRGVVEDFSGFGSAAGGIEFWMRSNPNFGNRTIVSYAAGSANAFHVGNPASLTVYRGNFSLDTGENLTDNEWHHVSVWYEIDQGNTLTLGATIDGGETHIETFSTSAGLMGATGRLVVGDYQTAPATSDPAYDPARSYRGQLAQVATYDTSRQSSYGGATPPPHIALPAHTGHYEADNDRSVELWFATGEDTTRRQVVYAEGAAATSGLVAYVDEERLWVGGWSAGEWEAFGDVSVDPNTTYHLTIVLDDNVLAGYLNGAEFWSTPAAGPLSERAAGTVGAAIRSVLFDDRSVASGSPMAGKVDEIALYDQALDPAAVRLHHELGSGTIVARELLEDGEDLAFGEAVATVRVASVGSPAEITATPVTADAFGQATYWVRACDEGGKCSDPKALDVSVVPTPDTPRAREGGVIAEMEEDVTLFEGFRLEGSDHPDVGTGGYTGEIARYRIVTPPAKGTLRYDHDGDPSTAPVNVTASGAEFTNPILSYKPSTPDGDGLIPFTYQVLDSGAPGGGTWSPTKVAWINVVDTNSAPTCQTGKTFSGTEDTQSTFSLTSVCSDPDGDPLTFMVTRGSGHKIQTATVSGSNLTFRANANECGTGSNNSKFPLNVSAKDPYGLTSNTVEVRVNVTCVNDPPTLAAGSIGPVLFEWGAEPNATSTNRTFSWTDPDSGQPGPTQTWTLEISSSSSSGYVTAPGVDVRYGRSAYGTNNANYYARIINNQNTSNLSEAVRFYAPRVCSTFPDDYDRTLGYLYVRVHDGHARSNSATVYVKCA